MAPSPEPASSAAPVAAPVAAPPAPPLEGARAGRLAVLHHAPGRRLVVAVRPARLGRAGRHARRALGALSLATLPLLLGLEALGGAAPLPSPGVELPLLLALGALGAGARTGARRGGAEAQEVELQDGDARVRRGARHWRIPARAIRHAALLERPARLALAVDLPDAPELGVRGGWATVLETPWETWARAGALRAGLEAALARLGLAPR
jgi:hypothetical protein